MTHVAVRLALPCDGALIAALIAEHSSHEGATARGRPEDFAQGLAEQAFDCLIAEQAGKALGLAMFYPTFSSWSGRRGLFLEDLYVRETARGLSVGRLLLVELAGIARSRGALRLDLVVQDANRAREFYARVGLREMPGWLLCRAEERALATLSAER